MAWLVVEVFLLMLATTALGMVLGVGARHGFTRTPAHAGAGGGTVTFAPVDEDAPRPGRDDPAPLDEDALLRAVEAAEAEAEAEAEERPVPAVPPSGEEPVAVADGIIDPDRAASADQVGVRPDPLAGPRGVADDLKRIRGIGPQNEARLNALGIFHFDQIAAWTPDEARWVGTYLAVPGRIERERWVEQAGVLSNTNG